MTDLADLFYHDYETDVSAAGLLVIMVCDKNTLNGGSMFK